MSEIIEVVSTIFVVVILIAGALLIGMVAIAGLCILWRELRTTFRERRTKELPGEERK